MNRTSTVSRYGLALRDHVSYPAEETLLLGAYELGRELMAGGMGLLEVVRLHSQAVEDLHPPRGHRVLWLSRAHAFLAEVLAPFEMAYLGFQEANTSLQDLTSSLEQQVADRTRDLQRTLSELQSAHAERRRLLERVVSAEEQERRRVSDDLHDDTVQLMTAVALRLSALGERADPEAGAALQRLETLVAQGIERLRRLMFELRPPALDHEGLGSALRTYLDMAFEGGPGYHVEDRLDRQPAVPVREAVYRIAQEALANVRKHARAGHVTVTLEPDRGGVQVTVADDGTGFEVSRSQRPRPGHLGLTSMRDRASLVGGSCVVESAPGCGTTVRAWVPLDQPASQPGPRPGAGG